MKDTIQSITDISYETSPVWERYSKSAKDLLHRLLRPASQRLDADEALMAPWFL